MLFAPEARARKYTVADGKHFPLPVVMPNADLPDFDFIHDISSLRYYSRRMDHLQLE